MSDTTPSVSEQTGIRSYEEYKQTRKVNQNLGKDEFLQLLAAQMQYQNPLEPTSDTDFIAQLAQFTSLQQMESLTSVMTTYQYYGLAGQYVYAEVRLDTGETAEIAGIVDRVIMHEGKSYAQVGDYLVDCEKITQVFDKDLLTGNSSLLESSNLIGKYLKAMVPGEGEDAKPVEVVGKCDRVVIEDNTLIAYLEDGTKVGLSDIIGISDTEFAASPSTGTDTGTGDTGGSGDDE